MFPIGVFNLLVRTFYVRRHVVTPVLVVLAFLTVQGALYVVLARAYGIAGVSWGTVIASWAQLALTLALVHRRERFGLEPFLRHAGIVWAAALVAAAAAALALRLAPLPDGWLGQLARVALGGGLLATVYLGLGAALGLPELAAVLRRLRR